MAFCMRARHTNYPVTDTHYQCFQVDRHQDFIFDDQHGGRFLAARGCQFMPLRQSRSVGSVRGMPPHGATGVRQR
jgi:hypothetical protein